MLATMEAAAAAAGKTTERFLADHWRGIGSRIAETMGRKKAARAAARVTLAEGRPAARKAAPAPAPVGASSAMVETEIAAAFRRGGLSAEGSSVAARGRAPREAGSLLEAFKAGGLTAGAARVAAIGRNGVREAVKNVAGLPASCFAWVPDPEDPTTWQLQIARSADGGNDSWMPEEDLARAAVLMVPGIATYDHALEIPASDLPTVKATLRAAWIACGAALAEMPFELNQEALRREFVRGGLSETGATTAARGRGRA